MLACGALEHAESKMAAVPTAVNKTIETRMTFHPISRALLGASTAAPVGGGHTVVRRHASAPSHPLGSTVIKRSHNRSFMGHIGDHDGIRLSESRKGVQMSPVNDETGLPAMSTRSSSCVSFRITRYCVNRASDLFCYSNLNAETLSLFL